MKRCSKCKEWKDESEFSKLKSQKDGINYTCKQCAAIYYQNNKEKVKARSKKTRINNKQELKKYFKEYAENNREKIAEYQKEYRIKNNEKTKEYRQTHIAEYNAHTMNRQARKLQATVSYSDSKAIKRIYRTAHILSKMIGRKMQVDHIIPLKNNLVCGLHHENNLQIISAERNRIKKNKFEPIVIDYK